MNLHRNPLQRVGTPLDEAEAAVVLVHGRGASPRDILRLASVLAVDRVTYLAPAASGNTWYPYSFLASLSQNEPWLSAAVEAVGTACDAAIDAGISRDRLFVGGFSQGACLSLEFVARNPGRYGGVFAFSGGLIGNGEIPDAEPPFDKRFDYEGAMDGTPVFLGCSDQDAHIPVERVHQSTDVFRRLGADVTERIYPGLGHTINEDEIEFARKVIRAKSEGHRA